jgi:hypothetical protein
VDRRERRRAAVVSVALVVAVAWPGAAALVGQDDDGFPLSSYPMFRRDPGRVVEVSTVVAVDGDGAVRRLSPEQIAQTDQVIQAGVTVRRAIAAGPDAALALCEDVADGLEGTATVAVVVERHDSYAWAAGDREPLERRQIAACESSP